MTRNYTLYLISSVGCILQSVERYFSAVLLRMPEREYVVFSAIRSLIREFESIISYL